MKNYANRRHSVILLFSITSNLLGFYAHSDPNTPGSRIDVAYPLGSESNIEHANYFTQLLETALQRSLREDERLYLNPKQKGFTQRRNLLEILLHRDFDVMWTVTSTEREKLFLPIRIPLLKGLIGYRVFLIKNGTQAVFDNLTGTEDLKKLSAGQGAHWPDTEILLENGFNVTTAPHYEHLFPMLKAGRFDYFPRGVNEVFLEAEKYRELAIEARFLISYPSAMYFFVAPDDFALAQRIERGLQIMIASGEFDDHFYHHPSVQPIFEKLQLQQREHLQLNNPLLPKNTPLNVGHFWHYPKKKRTQ